MKKWLVAGFLLVASMSFASHGDQQGSVGDAMVTVIEKPSAEVMEKHNEMMKLYLSAEEKTEVEKNRAEIKTLLEAKEPDWKKIESLNDKNALIMSKAKTKMMKEGFKK